MKAIVYETYGPPSVLQFKELPKPIPKDNEVLIRTRATTVTAGDWRVRSLEVPAGFGVLSRLALGIFGPRQKILGSELAGEIESVGKNVTRFKAGDEVFAFPGLKMGSYVEYKCMPEDGPLAAKPANLTFDEAAAMSFGGTTALDFFRRAKLRSGEKVLVNGASGGVGTAAVQLARHFGADVTGVCSSANADLVKSIGASRVIDYTKEDFTKNGETYDVIVDAAGTSPFSRCKKSLKDGGRLLMILGRLSDILKAPWVAISGSKRIVAGTAAARGEDLRYLADLARSGEFKPVIDRRYRFDQMAEAHAYVDTGRKRGNVVVTLD
ncbi:MAG: NAD(P)-dependent alcohol dehydrogenase [Thermoanaerobaculia bacterium]